MHVRGYAVLAIVAMVIGGYCPPGGEDDSSIAKPGPDCSPAAQNYYGPGSCAAGQAPVSASRCCPLTKQYWCAYENSCHHDCNDAKNACGTTNSVWRPASEDPTPNPEQPQGEVIFYVEEAKECPRISVSIRDKNGDNPGGTVIKGPSDRAHCGAKGGGTTALRPGQYTYKAKCKGESWEGSFTVQKYKCTSIVLE